MEEGEEEEEEVVIDAPRARVVASGALAEECTERVQHHLCPLDDISRRIGGGGSAGRLCGVLHLPDVDRG